MAAGLWSSTLAEIKVSGVTSIDSVFRLFSIESSENIACNSFPLVKYGGLPSFLLIQLLCCIGNLNASAAGCRLSLCSYTILRNSSAISPNSFPDFCFLNFSSTWSFTSSKFTISPAFTEESLIMWKPNSVWTGPRTSSGSIWKISSSKALTNSPRLKNPKSPPLSAVPASCEYFLARSAKLCGACLICDNNSSALARAAALSVSDAVVGAISKIWLARRSSIWPNSALCSSKYFIVSSALTCTFLARSSTDSTRYSTRTCSGCRNSVWWLS